MLISSLQQNVIADEYKLLKLMAKSKHANVYRCVSIKTGRQYAVKVQPKGSTSLLREASLLSAINKQSKIAADFGLPTCFCIEQNQKRIALVEDLLGDNLQDLRKKCNGIFTITTFLSLADQMVKRLQSLHQKQYIHRAITLKKWVMGMGKNQKKLYLIGFGRAKHYIKEEKHIEYAQKKLILNQIQYASINNHLGLQPSRRDDLESMIYCWAKVLYGTLPWQNEKEPEKILSKKIEQRGDLLFSQFPSQLKQIANYVRSLNFLQTPDYNKIRNLLMQSWQEYDLEYTGFYDWQQKNNALQDLKDKI